MGIASQLVCGRIVSSSPVSVLAEQFGVTDVLTEDRAPRFNVAPTDNVLAVVTRHEARCLGTFVWGLVPGWSTTRTRRVVNLRSEGIAERRGFRSLVQRRRCLVPVDGFYEWRRATLGRPKQPFLIRSRDGVPLALAGLWDSWSDPNDPSGPRLRTCTILTTTPNRGLAGIHHRMPAILDRDAQEEWLDPSITNTDGLSSLLRPCPDDQLDLIPVGTAVNNVRNDGPELIERAASPPADLSLFGD